MLGPANILPSLMLTHRGWASRTTSRWRERFNGELLQEPSACRHGMSHRVAIPDSGNTVLYSQFYYRMWGWLYPDTDFSNKFATFALTCKPCSRRGYRNSNSPGLPGVFLPTPTLVFGRHKKPKSNLYAYKYSINKPVQLKSVNHYKQL